MKTDLFIELNGQKTDTRHLSDTAKEIWKAEGNRVKDLEVLELYYKPDEHVCYYIMNGDMTGSFEA